MADNQLIAGLHAVRTALKHGAGSIVEVWVDEQRRDGRMKEIIKLVKDTGVTLHKVDKKTIEKLVPDTNNQGVAARTRVIGALGEKALYDLLDALDRPPFLLVLDGVQDPHNLGACLRSADAAGIDAVITPRDRSAGLTPTACKIACGAAESMPFVQVTNLARTLRKLQKDYFIHIVGTAGEAEEQLFDVNLTGSLALVMGGEEKGLRHLTRETCDQLVKLPMAGVVESLNISVAAGVSLFEAVRQRR